MSRRCTTYNKARWFFLAVDFERERLPSQKDCKHKERLQNLSERTSMRGAKIDFSKELKDLEHPFQEVGGSVLVVPSFTRFVILVTE
jgi:hypothetical protein